MSSRNGKHHLFIRVGSEYSDGLRNRNRASGGVSSTRKTAPGLPKIASSSTPASVVNDGSTDSFVDRSGVSVAEAPTKDVGHYATTLICVISLFSYDVATIYACSTDGLYSPPKIALFRFYSGPIWGVHFNSAIYSMSFVCAHIMLV